MLRSTVAVGVILADPDMSHTTATPTGVASGLQLIVAVLPVRSAMFTAEVVFKATSIAATYSDWIVSGVATRLEVVSNVDVTAEDPEIVIRFPTALNLAEGATLSVVVKSVDIAEVPHCRDTVELSSIFGHDMSIVFPLISI